MKKNLIMFLICSPLLLMAQPDNLYLVMGHPYPHISTQFPGIIFQLENDSLIEILQFSEPLLLLENIRYYPELNYLSIVTSEHRKREGKKVLQAIFTNELNTVKEAEVKFRNYLGVNCIKSELISVNQNEVYDCFTCPDIKNKKLYHFGINIYTGQAKEILPQDFANSLISGSPGGALDAWDIQLLYTNPENGRLAIPKTTKIEDRPHYPLVIPDSLQLREKTRVGVQIKNSFVTAINKKIIDSDRESIGMCHYLIFNTQTERWHTMDVEGSSTVVRGFGEWIAGSVAASNVELIFDEQGRLKEKIPLSRISPGIEDRRKKGTDTGTPFDLRADFFDLYYPGILFLHNINTGEIIKWNTNQGDSEILLVQDDIVYYRINDKIFKASIINSESLGESELLVQDERVPDIHWAFISFN